MRPKALLLVLAYNAEQFIEETLERIPASAWNHRDLTVETLIIDDQSTDRTFLKALRHSQNNQRLKITILHNPERQGYGGNQKLGFRYAIQNRFDIVIVLNADGKYPPERIEHLARPIIDNEADAVLGTRMLNPREALRGGMPLHKWLGNLILSFAQNTIIGARLTEYHTGFRAYRVEALERVPFEVNSNGHDFDTDMIIQLTDTGHVIGEIPIPTHYGNDRSQVNGIYYAWSVIQSAIQSRLIKRGIFYHPKFDYASEGPLDHYVGKFGYPSSHEFALAHVTQGETALDIGCGPGHMTRELALRGVTVISIDRAIQPQVRQYSLRTIEADIEQYDFNSDNNQIDTILLLDIIEHLKRPQAVFQKIRERYSRDKPQVIITTANIGFISTRLGLLFGQFNYGKQGILDLDHARLFTFGSLRRMLADNGYAVKEVKGIPVPFPRAVGDNKLARLLCKLNEWAILLSKGLFAYQIGVVAQPTPTLSHLLDDAQQSGQKLQNKWLEEATARGLRLRQPSGSPPVKAD